MINEDKEEIIFKLYQKGKKNLTQFDKLTIEANPEIKSELTDLFENDSDIHDQIIQKLDKNINEKIIKEKQKTIINIKHTNDKSFHFPFFLASPIAACMVLFIFFLKVFSPQTALGATLSLFASSSDKPNNFYKQGSLVDLNEPIQLSFQVNGEIEPLKKGILFSIDNNLESDVYYQFHYKDSLINQKELTKIKPDILLTNNTEYIYFLLVFSDKEFIDKEVIEQAHQIIRKKQKNASRFLSTVFKKEYFSSIYLQVEKK